MKEAILALGEEEAGTEGTIGSDSPERAGQVSPVAAGQGRF
jgi:hypothetical protein